MNCPQCGTPNHPQARQCVRCGLLLRSTGVPNSSQQYPSPPRADMPRRGPTGPSNQANYNSSHSTPPDSDPWSEPQSNWNQMPPTGGNQQVPTPYNDPYGRSGPSMPPRGTPLSSPIPNSGRWDAPPGSLPYPRNEIPQPMVSNTMSGGLYGGATLQSGRFKILTPYTSSRQTDPARLFVPWVAIDVERRGDRVVILELPFVGVSIQEAERIRQELTRRLITISSHENLQKVYGSFSEQNRQFLLLEYVEGEWLRDRIIQGGPLREGQAFQIATCILSALEHLENQSPSAVHGAINPDTIVLDSSSRMVCLVGWDVTAVASMSNISLPGIVSQPVIGYTSPEQQKGEHEPRNDIYSLGATLYYAVSGMQSNKATGLFTPARQFNENLSSSFEALLGRTVRMIASQRYQHAIEMHEDIERIERGEPISQGTMDHLDPVFRRGNTGALTIITVLSLLLVTVLVIAFIVRNPEFLPQNSVAPQPTSTIDPIMFASYADRQGISSGILIFDTKALDELNAKQGNPNPTPSSSGDWLLPIPDNLDKNTPSPASAIVAELEGSAALRHNNYATAVNDFQKAVNLDRSNAEARIYLSNAQIAASGTKNYVTIAVGVSFGSGDLEISRSVLRSVWMAQDELNHNSALMGNKKVRIIIGSVGSNAAGAPLMTKLMIEQLNGGNPDHVIGVVSWSPHNMTADVGKSILASLTQLEQAKLPVIAPVRTADQIPANPYFFHLSPSNKDQATTIAQVALGTPFNATKSLVVFDYTNVRDLDQYQTVAGVLQRKLGTTKVFPYPMYKDSKDPGYDTIVQAALTYGVNNIVYLGNSTDLVQMSIRLAGKNLHIPIIAGPTADSPVIIGRGDNDLAQLALDNPDAMQSIHVVGLTDSQEWTYLAKTGKNIKAPDFFDNYSNTYSTPNESVFVDDNAILSYDTVNMMIKSVLRNQLWNDTHVPKPTDLHDALLTYNDSSPYQGISGRIAFGQDNLPTNRSMNVKDVVLSETVDAKNHKLLVWSVTQIVPPGSFCANDTSCSPS
jgi:ABC-type branched-subunit amino acid transport system substrate-binding protein